MGKTQNSRVALGLILGACLILALFIFLPKGRVNLDSGHRLVMGTFARVVAVAANLPAARRSIKAASAEIDKVDQTMSDYKTDSELSLVNRNAYKTPVRVSKPLFEVLQRAITVSRLTHGAFDITVGPLVDLFHSEQKNAVAPTDEQIAQAKAKVGYEKLKLNKQNNTVRFAVDGMRLDLGAIAKGYAVDKAVEAMKKAGALGGMVDIGGDIRCFGIPPKGKHAWRIGLQDPTDTNDIATNAGSLVVLSLSNAAVATSGDYQRFALIGGKKYSHIINTQTGRSTNGLTSVTIIAKNATDADALATAVSVMGIEKGIALIEKIPNTEAILIPSTHPHQLIKTTGAERFLH